MGWLVVLGIVALVVLYFAACHSLGAWMDNLILAVPHEHEWRDD